MTHRVLIVDDQYELIRAPLAAEFPEITFDAVPDPAEAVPFCADALAIIALGHLVTAEMIAAAARLRWIGAITTGTDHLHTLGLPEDVIITSARGIHNAAVTEFAFMAMLALTRRLPVMLANQREHRWDRTRGRLLAGRTLTIVGAGAISETLAERAGSFGMRVIGVSSGRSEVPGFDAIYPRERLAEAAALADFLVLLVPQTPATMNLVDARVLAAMKPSAFVINIARGGVLDADALLAALREERIAGALLDVFVPEPLPPEHPFWSMDNVIVTPHAGGDAWDFYERLVPLLATNLRAICEDRPGDLLNVVPRKG